jgi:hypothetical protein
LIAIMLPGLLWAVNPGAAGADSNGTLAPSLTIKTGYSGGTFTPVKFFTDSDFAGAVEQDYSFMDEMPSPVMDAARGVPLASLLASAGISAGSVSYMAFWTTDRQGAPYCTLPMSFFNSPGYYYPNEMKYWNSANDSFTDANGVDQTVYAMSQAVPVVPMMCIEDNWERGAKAPDSSALTTGNKYRLVYGQSSSLTVTDAMDSAKWVDEIDVMLNGTAVTGVSLNKTSDTIAAGATGQLTATIAPANATNQSVTWSSSNPAVATVNSVGLITGVAAGAATITVTTVDGGKTATCAVTVTSPGGGGGGGGATAASVVLTTPAAGQTYHPGDGVTISGTAQGLSTVTVTVTDPGGKTIYSGNNLAVNSGVFTTSATLSSDAATGNYSIEISGTGLASSVAGTFMVSAGASTPVQTPAANNPASPAAPAATNSGGAANFSDLSGHWGQQQIADLVARGVLAGMTPTEFMPDANITRAQFATMLDRILNIGPPQQAGPAFGDVASGAWYYDNVSAAVYAGLVSGYSNGLFGPDDPVTREQMAVMVARALMSQLKITGPDQATVSAILAKFQDQQEISGWAGTGVALVVQQGIIHGRTSATFAPQVNATRTEAAVMIWLLDASLWQAGGAAPAPAS